MLIILSKVGEHSTAYDGTDMQPKVIPLSRPEIHLPTSSNGTGEVETVAGVAYTKPGGLKLRKRGKFERRVIANMDDGETKAGHRQ